MENRAGKRRDTVNDAGLDYLEIRKAGEITEAQLNNLAPFFNELRQVIHDKWEHKCSLSDGVMAKMLHFQLTAVNNLQEAMKRSIVHGKQATKKLEEMNRA